MAIIDKEKELFSMQEYLIAVNWNVFVYYFLSDA